MAKFGRGEHEESSEHNTRRIATAVEYLARLELLKRKGKGKVVSDRKEVPGGGTLNLHLKNPSDTNIDCNVSQIVVSTQFRGIFTVYDTFSSAPSNGTTLEIDNLKMDSGDDIDGGVMEANKDVTYTASNSAHWVETLPSGGAGGQTGGSGLGSEPRIEPNREIVVEVENQSTNSRYASIGIIYTEEDTE